MEGSLKGGGGGKGPAIKEKLHFGQKKTASLMGK